MTEDKSLIRIDKGEVQKVDRVANEYAVALQSEDRGSFEKSLLMAEAITALDAAITDEMMTPLMQLQGTSFGFKTDKDKEREKYDVATVKKCFIEARMRGVNGVGNHFNIISGHCYITREGFSYLLSPDAAAPIHGLTDLKIVLGVPAISPQGAVVHFDASWKIKEKSDSLSGDVPIKTYKTDGADLLLGKADRKAKCRIYNHITGSTLGDGDATDVTPIVEVSEPLPKRPQPKSKKKTAPPEDKGEDIIAVAKQLETDASDENFIKLREKAGIDTAEALEMVEESKVKELVQLHRATRGN